MNMNNFKILNFILILRKINLYTFLYFKLIKCMLLVANIFSRIRDMDKMKIKIKQQK